MNRELLISEIESFKCMISDAKEKIVTITKDSASDAEMEITLDNGNPFYISTEGGKLAIIGHIIGELQMCIEDWTSELKSLEVKLEELDAVKQWRYNISTNTIWVDFDTGVVEARTWEEAYEKSLSKLRKDLDEANAILDGKFTIEMSFDELNVEEEK